MPRALLNIGLLTTLAAGVAGCPKINLPSGLPDLSQFTPKLRFDKLELDEIDFQHAEVDFLFQVDNPNPLKVNLASFSYDLALAGAPLLKGSSSEGVGIEAEGSSQIRLPVSVAFADLFSAAQDLRGKTEVPFEIKGDFGFQTPLGEVKVPYTETGMFPVVRPPKVRVQKVRVEGLNLLQQRADLAVDLGVSNEHGAGIELGQFDYQLSFGESQVATGNVATLASVDALSEQTVSLPLQLKLVDLGAAVVRAITDKEKLDVGLNASVQVGTPLGPIPLSIDETGKVQVQ